MYSELATRLVVTSTADQFTAAMEVATANALQPDYVVIAALAGITLTFDPQGSNDMQNWTSLGITSTANQAGVVFGTKGTNIAFRHVRVRVNSSSSTASIVSIGMNTAAL